MKRSALVEDNPQARELAQSFVGEFDLTQGLLLSDLELLRLLHLLSKAGTEYSVTRQLGDITKALNVSNGAFRRFMAGKRFLEIGCGSGDVSAAIAKDKSVSVVGIDIASNFRHLPAEGGNLTFMQADGYEVRSIFGREFDVTASIYSHVYWARHPEEAKEGIRTTLDVTKPGGSAIFVPVVSKLEQRKQLLETQADNPEALRTLHAASYMMATSINELLQSEANGEVALAFTESARNQQQPGHNSYSVVAQVL